MDGTQRNKCGIIAYIMTLLTILSFRLPRSVSWQSWVVSGNGNSVFGFGSVAASYKLVHQNLNCLVKKIVKSNPGPPHNFAYVKPMACLNTLKQEIRTLEQIFGKHHERFQIISASVDELSCRFIGKSGKKYIIHANITVSCSLNCFRYVH